jgi:hypothetical protein
LLVEDFGTSGLTGPLESDELQPDEKTHRLYWFFKNVGRTSKTGEQLGSFGIGKTVFPYSSLISSFFGLSVRQQLGGEPTVVLVGMSQLREHKLATGRVLVPYGYFAWQDGEGPDYEQRAISEPLYLDAFRTAFGLTRGNDEMGLSVVIPYPAPGLSRRDLAQAAISQFFLPILSGQLVVEIHDHDQHDVLSATTLLEVIERFPWKGDEAEGLKRQLLLAKWAIDNGGNERVDFKRPSSNTQPKFEHEMIDAGSLAQMSRNFVSGRRLSVRVPVPVEPKGSPLVWSHVDVYLEYDRNGTTKDDLYVRKGLTLIDHCGQARQRGLRSVLAAEDAPVYEMLRSSENVAHTQWRQKNAAKLKQQYERGPSKIGYVLGIVPGLVQALLSPGEEADWWTLADFFPESDTSPLPERPVSSVDDASMPTASAEETPTEDEESQVGPFPPPSVRQWRLGATRNGVRIEANPGYLGDLKAMRFTAAYAVLRGRKLRGHEAHDFSFQTDEDMIKAHDAAVEPISHNVIRIRPSSREFCVDLKGFDRRRALDYQIAVEDE